ncbi:lipid-A-disaccharide synthase [Roseovarius aestuarii]|uniref:Lipid-A-disaccharide synthase n=1 Tax=Roseovarius aestuarii TaxID=475083 RepID=A0A1X7BPR8_9RHOB|nr:lipid-A-disaccharide synthase [Roseovarius aestuarii]SMC11591.1 Lipid-A-disaccharide synthase [Roseovarius aestuarii]
MRVFLVAGEASGDRLGAALMAGLKTLEDVEFLGVGGPLMQAEGMTSLFPMDELSVMGLAEILPKYPHLKRRLHQTAEAVLEAQPDVLITIDSPDFSLRVAKLVKAKSSIRTVHYVAPSVWAWRAGRAVKMARVIDHVLALLPFEPPFMETAGMECDFVGHPVVAEPIASDTEVAEFKTKYETGDDPVLLVLPGSRRGEVTRLGPTFGKALGRVLQRHPALKLVIPTTASVAGLVKEVVADWPVRPIILDPNNMRNDVYKADKAASFRLSNWALAASGTVSLELAAAETPMVIAYDMNWISRAVISRMLKVDTLTLVNLVSETRAVPECLGKDCQADVIAPKLLKLMESPDDQIAAMRLTMKRLGKGGEAPGLRAAKAVLTRMP